MIRKIMAHLRDETTYEKLRKKPDSSSRHEDSPFPAEPMGGRCSVVYEATCLSWDAIGETQQSLHKRVYQHAAPNSSSAIADPTCQTGHASLWPTSKYWREKTTGGRRGIREAVRERVRSPTLNRNRGLRYCLSHKWDRPLGVSQTSITPEDGHRKSVRNVE